MLCPKCGTENPADAHFCGSCGELVQSALSDPIGPVTELGTLPDSPPSDILSQDLKPEDTTPGAPEADTTVIPGKAGIDDPSPPPPVSPRIDPDAPGAGLAPPSAGAVPPPGRVPPPGYAPPMPPPGQTMQAPPVYPGGSYGMPPDGNTSGMGEGYPIPPQASGWTFAGFIPYGIYSFVNGNVLWGVLWWVFSIFGLTLIYCIYIGIQGKEQAWRNRRFDSIQQFEETMRAWNMWGIALLCLGVFVILGYFVFLFVFIGLMAAEGM